MNIYNLSGITTIILLNDGREIEFLVEYLSAELVAKIMDKKEVAHSSPAIKITR